MASLLCILAALIAANIFSPCDAARGPTSSKRSWSFLGATESARSIHDHGSVAFLHEEGQSVSTALENVKGGSLGECSTPGTAMTGFTRDGKCVDEGNDDEGSHHICVRMKSDFCTVTGQPNWCTEEMPCMGEDGKESSGKKCPIKNWCVCQWAFAGYLEAAKEKGSSCEETLELECDATNMAALKAYEAQASKSPKIQNALACLKKKCDL